MTFSYMPRSKFVPLALFFLAIAGTPFAEGRTSWLHSATIHNILSGRVRDADTLGHWDPLEERISLSAKLRGTMFAFVVLGHEIDHMFWQIDPPTITYWLGLARRKPLLMQREERAFQFQYDLLSTMRGVLKENLIDLADLILEENKIPEHRRTVLREFLVGSSIESGFRPSEKFLRLFEDAQVTDPGFAKDWNKVDRTRYMKIQVQWLSYVLEPSQFSRKDWVHSRLQPYL